MLNDKHSWKDNRNDLFSSRVPILIWTTIVYAATIVLQFYHEPLILAGAVFSGLFTVHALLHWYSYRVPPRQFWFYFAVQGILIYLCTILMPGGYQAVLVGLLPVLIAQSLAFSFRFRRAVFVALLSIIIFFDSALTIHATDTEFFT